MVRLGSECAVWCYVEYWEMLSLSQIDNASSVDQERLFGLLA